jgi:hypothetical protein
LAAAATEVGEKTTAIGQYNAIVIENLDLGKISAE